MAAARAALPILISACVSCFCCVVVLGLFVHSYLCVRVLNCLIVFVLFCLFVLFLWNSSDEETNSHFMHLLWLNNKVILYCVVVFSCAQTMVRPPMIGIFNVRRDVDACDCSWGPYGHRKTVCTGSRLWKKNLLPHRRLEPASVLRRALQQWDALPTELFRTSQKFR